MTERIYWEDPYAREFSARITAIKEGCVSLDRTAFYPTGGGQPSDLGTISAGERSYNVTDVRKDGDDVLHALDSTDGISVGQEADCSIDWKRRYAHMRYHTALHVMDGVVQKDYEGRITGGQIYQDRARMDFDVPGMNREVMQRIVDDAQRIADRGLRVRARYLSREEAVGIPDLARTSPGAGMMENMERVRVIDIEGFDMQMDGGTHVANTKEIGRMVLKDYKNNGAHSKRVYIVLEDQG